MSRGASRWPGGALLVGRGEIAACFPAVADLGPARCPLAPAPSPPLSASCQDLAQSCRHRQLRGRSCSEAAAGGGPAGQPQGEGAQLPELVSPRTRTRADSRGRQRAAGLTPPGAGLTPRARVSLTLNTPLPGERPPSQDLTHCRVFPGFRTPGGPDPLTLAELEKPESSRGPACRSGTRGHRGREGRGREPAVCLPGSWESLWFPGAALCSAIKALLSWFRFNDLEDWDMSLSTVSNPKQGPAQQPPRAQARGGEHSSGQQLVQATRV